MSCCDKTKETPTTKIDFLKEKAKNFREFILKYSPEEDVKSFLMTFDESKLQYTILTTLLPMKAVKSEGIYIQELMDKLTIPANEEEAVRNKIHRYFDMFIEVLVSMA